MKSESLYWVTFNNYAAAFEYSIRANLQELIHCLQKHSFSVSLKKKNPVHISNICKSVFALKKMEIQEWCIFLESHPPHAKIFSFSWRTFLASADMITAAGSSSATLLHLLLDQQTYKHPSLLLLRNTDSTVIGSIWDRSPASPHSLRIHLYSV